MELQPSYSFFPLGDAAVLMDCGAVMDPSINAFVIQCFQQLQAARLSFITDLVPAYASLTIHYNTPMVRAGKIEEESCYEAVTREIERLLQHSIVQSSERRLLRIPVCYNEALGPDLAELAKAKGLTTDDVIRIHTSRTYRVYMLGFLPGFAYMGEVAPDIAMPRHAQPRRGCRPDRSALPANKPAFTRWHHRAAGSSSGAHQ